MKELPLNGFGPDLDPVTPGYFLTGLGLDSTKRGWKIQRGFTTSATGTGSSMATDALMSRTANGTTVFHVAGRSAGGARNLYFKNGAALTSANRAAAYNTSADQWSFCQWGNYTLAGNLLDTVQQRLATGTTAFADSAATAIPKAKILVSWGPPTLPMVMALHYDDGTVHPGGFWSTPTPTTDWTPDIANGIVNNQVIVEDGAFTAGIGFRDGLLAWSGFHMWQATYTGTGNIVEWSRITDDIGCVGMYARTNMNGVCYFLGRQGLYYFDGSFPKKLNVPIQDYLIQWLTANATSAQYALVVADTPSQRLLIALRDTTFTVQKLFSVNLLNMKVAQLVMPGSPITGLGNGGVLNDKYWFSVTYANPSNISLFTDATTPYAGLTVGAYFVMAPSGDYDNDSYINRVHARFVDQSHLPTTLTIRHDVYDDPGALTPTYSKQSALTASPWRADVAGSGKWHAIVGFVETDGTAVRDPELISLALDTDQPKPAGRK